MLSFVTAPSFFSLGVAKIQYLSLYLSKVGSSNAFSHIFIFLYFLPPSTFLYMHMLHCFEPLLVLYNHQICMGTTDGDHHLKILFTNFVVFLSTVKRDIFPLVS